jgi:hypothetical protein
MLFGSDLQYIIEESRGLKQVEGVAQFGELNT